MKKMKKENRHTNREREIEKEKSRKNQHTSYKKFYTLLKIHAKVFADGDNGK